LHLYEAVLASLSIPAWHLYMVMFDPDVYPMDRSWITGKTSAEHMRHTRPEYHARLIAATRSAEPLPGEAAVADEPSDDS
jgi:hypothetical protein